MPLATDQGMPGSSSLSSSLHCWISGMMMSTPVASAKGLPMVLLEETEPVVAEGVSVAAEEAGAVVLGRSETGQTVVEMAMVSVMRTVDPRPAVQSDAATAVPQSVTVRTEVVKMVEVVRLSPGGLLVAMASVLDAALV